MRISERSANLVIGLNVIGWAAMGLVMSEPAARWTPVRITIALLNLLVGYLFITRSPLKRAGSLWACALVLPSFIAWGLAFRLAPSPELWPWYASALFCFAAAISAFALFKLGASFAVLPAVRAVVARGPYEIIRHPAYAGELLMVVACALARPSIVAVVLFIAAALCIALRILSEERLLNTRSPYRDYAARVKWRLVPGLW